MSKWIVSESAASDVGGALHPLLTAADDPDCAALSAVGSRAPIASYKEMSEIARLPDVASRALLDDLVELGATDVKELTADDWQSLPSWSQLRMLEKRRVLQLLFGARAS